MEAKRVWNNCSSWWWMLPSVVLQYNLHCLQQCPHVLKWEHLFGPHISLLPESCHGPSPTYSRCRGLMVVSCRDQETVEWVWLLPRVNLSLQVAFRLRCPAHPHRWRGLVSCAKVPEHVHVVHEESGVPALKVVMPYSPWPLMLPPSTSSEVSTIGI